MNNPGLLLKTPSVMSDDLFKEFEDMFNGFRRTMALKTAVDLKLFSSTRHAVSPNYLSRTFGWDEIMCRMFLDCLADDGFLIRENDTYRNSEKTALYLDPASSRYQGTNMNNAFIRIIRWLTLEDYIEGGPSVVPVSEIYGEKWLRAIGESALGGGISKTVSFIAEHAKMPNEGTFLDLGGGHGLYTIALCRKFPGLKGIVFDKPEMIGIAQEMFASYGCDASTIPGDFFIDSLGGPYDVIFSSFNHSISDSSLCEKVFGAIKPNGLLIMRRHVPRDPPKAHIMMEWNMVIREGAEKGKQTFRGSWLPTSEEYIGRMIKLGMDLLEREDMGDGSEIVIMKRRSV